MKATASSVCSSHEAGAVAKLLGAHCHGNRHGRARPLPALRRETCADAAEFEALVQRNLAANAGLGHAGLARLIATLAARELRRLRGTLSPSACACTGGVWPQGCAPSEHAAGWPAGPAQAPACCCLSGGCSELPARGAGAAGEVGVAACAAALANLIGFKRRAAWGVEGAGAGGAAGAAAAAAALGAFRLRRAAWALEALLANGGWAGAGGAAPADPADAAATPAARAAARAPARGNPACAGSSECGATGSAQRAGRPNPGRVGACGDPGAPPAAAQGAGAWVEPEEALCCGDDAAVGRLSRRLVAQIWAVLAATLCEDCH